MTTERAHFRLIIFPCCHYQMCYVNPRLPNYCPECGSPVFAKLKTEPTHIRVSDPDAIIQYNPQS